MEYSEQQHLKLWWIYILLGIETIITLSILFLDKGGMGFEELKEMYFLPIFAILLPYMIVYLVNRNKLTFQIDHCGIKYHFWPFSRQKSISWTQINQMYLRKYDAFGEYGGWGARYRLWFKFNDKAFIFNDKSLGLQLVLSNDKKILFSTQNPDELSLFLINLKKSNNIGAIETDVRERER